MKTPSEEYRRFTAELAGRSFEAAALAVGRYMARHGFGRPAPGAKPWDLTPGTALHLARFLLRHAAAEGSPTAESDLPALVKSLYYLRDERSRALLRSPRAEDKFELSLRADYARSFHDMRSDLYWARLHRLFRAVEAAGQPGVELFGLPLDDLFLVPYAIREALRGGRTDVDAARLAPFLPAAGYDAFVQAVSLDKAEFDRRFDAGFDPEYFETAFNPLLESPCVRLGGRIVPVAPQHLFARVADLRFDALQKRAGGAFLEAMNGAVLAYIRRLLAQYNPRAQEVQAGADSGGASRYAILLKERCGDHVLLQVVPNRIQGIHATTCNVFNIYERVAAFLAPAVLSLVERIDRTGAKRAIPAIVSFQPLQASNLSHLKACVARILRDAYEIPESKIPRYGLLDLGEFELCLHSLAHFRDLADLFERKRDREHRDQTFQDFLHDRLGARFREFPLLAEVEAEMQPLHRAALRRAGGR